MSAERYSNEVLVKVGEIAEICEKFGHDCDIAVSLIHKEQPNTASIVISRIPLDELIEKLQGIRDAGTRESGIKTPDQAIVDLLFDDATEEP